MFVEPLAAHIFLPLSCEMSVTGESVPHEDLLARVEVLRREGDLGPAFAVDRHHVGDEVDGTVEQRRDALRVA